MISFARLAWLQLRRQTLRFTIALAGVGFAVVLMFMQVGFMDALFRSAVLLHRRLAAEVVMVPAHYDVISSPRRFPRRRLYQALGFPGVAAASPLYVDLVRWRNPDTGRTRNLFVFGVDPTKDAIDLPEIAAQRALLRYPDVVLFDELSRPEFGPVPALFRERGAVTTEANRREVTVRGLFQLGTSFGVDGSLVTSETTLFRLVPGRRPGALSVGLLRLAPGADAEAVRDGLAAALPADVELLTMPEFMAREVRFWATSTPIGYVFTFGVVMGVVVGGIIVYQILFADIADHLPEYATLKAMGYADRYLAGLVLVEALILAFAGFLPGLAACAWLYDLTSSATGLPMSLSVDRSLLVLGLTILMCCVSGFVAMRKLRTADPAEVF
jgi:putative ABC transport system permease protein